MHIITLILLMLINFIGLPYIEQENDPEDGGFYRFLRVFVISVLETVLISYIIFKIQNGG